MPIEILCPGCSTRLAVADAAAGLTAKCPKCGDLMTVPAVVEAKAVSPPPELVRARDDEADRPRRKPRRYEADDRPRRKRKSAGPSVGLIFGLVAGVLVLAMGGVVVFYLAGQKSDPGPVAAKGVSRPVLPPGWIDFTADDGSFQVYLPAPPAHLRNATDREVRSLEYFVLPGPQQRIGCELRTLTLPRSMPSAQREQLRDFYLHPQQPLGVTEVSRKDVTWAGRPAVEMVHQTAPGARAVLYRVVRVLADGDRVISFTLYRQDAPLTDADRQAFFDSLRLN
jgi:hypothetical protein